MIQILNVHERSGSRRCVSGLRARSLTAGHRSFHIQHGRTGIALPPDAILQSLEALTGGFHLGEDYLVQMPDLEGRQEPPPHVGKVLLVQRDEPFRRSDAEEFDSRLLARQLTLELLVF